MIEKKFDIPFVADLALREKQIQQNYRPIIAVHKWFARRPGTLFRAILLSEFADEPLAKAFYRPNAFPKLRVADPFMGGGTPLLEANRLSCSVTGSDINPMSYWIVKQEIEHLDIATYDNTTTLLRNSLQRDIGHLYRTRCTLCGNEQADVKYFLWVKTIECQNCRGHIDLFPGYLVASDVRHPKNVFVCSSCGLLTETNNKKTPGPCSHCGTPLSPNGPAKRNSCKCSHCHTVNHYPRAESGPPQHHLFAMEYHCQRCKRNHEGRFFKVPDEQDRARVAESERRWSHLKAIFVPEDPIPTGDETNRLHRWGYQRYREMFNARQLLGLELSTQYIATIANERVRNALATNLSDLLRYQNMLCRYDSMALKSLDIFSVHGFPVGLIQCESNLLGIVDPQKKICVGSGGWKNITEKFRRAKLYCDAPFEVRHHGKRKEIVPIPGEWIGDNWNGQIPTQNREVDIQCCDSATIELPEASLDAVLTDPPYFGNVQYAELMDFCYVWLRRLLHGTERAFTGLSTRNQQELTCNVDMGRGVDHFTEGLSSVFQRMAKALKPGSPFVFTYHHNTLAAYLPVAVALLDSGLTCSASIPCPAEMGASIHISGTGSSIIDTVFTCRTSGVVSRRFLPTSIQGVSELVQQDLMLLRQGNVQPSSGDTRCIAYGHLIRLAIWNLRATWDRKRVVSEKIALVSAWLNRFGGWQEIETQLQKISIHRDEQYSQIFETHEMNGGEYADISF